MGFRFRSSFKIAPGVKVNVGKKSASVSFGSKGLRHTINTSGRTTTTVGVLGSGLSYSASSRSSRKKPKLSPEQSQADALIKQAAESTKLINSTVKPDVFFGRLNFLLDVLIQLKGFEKSKILTGEKPSKTYQRVISEMEKHVHSFINRSYFNEKQAADSLKTEKARKARMDRYFDKMLNAFENSHTFWQGGQAGSKPLPHYRGPLYTPSNLAYLKSLQHTEYNFAQTPVSLTDIPVRSPGTNYKIFNEQQPETYNTIKPQVANYKIFNEQKLENVGTTKYCMHCNELMPAINTICTSCGSLQETVSSGSKIDGLTRLNNPLSTPSPKLARWVWGIILMVLGLAGLAINPFIALLMIGAGAFLIPPLGAKILSKIKSNREKRNKKALSPEKNDNSVDAIPYHDQTD